MQLNKSWLFQVTLEHHANSKCYEIKNNSDCKFDIAKMFLRTLF